MSIETSIQIGTTTILSLGGSWAIVYFVARRGVKYVDSYLDTKAKNLATKEDIQVFVDQVRESERAKIEAQSESIDQLITITKALTDTTETIKAKVFDETWDRHQRWSFKKEVYVELSKGLMHLGYKMAMVEGFLRHNDPPNDEMSNRLITETEGYLGCLRTLMETVAIAGLVSSNDAAETLERVFSDFPIPQTLTPDVLTSHRKALIKTATRFIEFAKADLGFTVTTDR